MESNSQLQMRISEMESLAIATFGSKSKADSWLNKENLTLGATPISLADSDSGLLEVKKILSAISYGGVV
jgi:uncharacterized protein (DUF2384 family)